MSGGHAGAKAQSVDYRWAPTIDSVPKELEGQVIAQALQLLSAYYKAKNESMNCLGFSPENQGRIVEFTVFDGSAPGCPGANSVAASRRDTFRVDWVDGDIFRMDIPSDQWLPATTNLDNVWFSLEANNTCVSNAGPAPIIKSYIDAGTPYKVEDFKNESGMVTYTSLSADDSTRAQNFYKGILRCAAAAIGVRTDEVLKVQGLSRYQ